MNDSMTPPFAAEWWTRVRAGEQVVQHCEKCGSVQMYPRRRCLRCGSADLGVKTVTGKGKLYTFTTVFRNAPSDFQEQLPYTLGVVILEEGPRMLTRMVNCTVEQLVCDLPVRWTLAKIGKTELPCFEPSW